MPAAVYIEEWDVDRRLADLGLTRPQLLEVVAACASARGGVTDNDPPTAKGWEVWRWGVRRLREVLRPQGWDKDDTEGFCTVANHQSRLKLAVVNTDEGTATLDALPQNRSRKGPTSERACITNQGLLPGLDWPVIRAEPSRRYSPAYSTWYLCVFVGGDEVRAELSLLTELESGFFSDFDERIFLVSPGEWKPGAISLDDDLGPEFEVEVLRR